MMLRCLAVLFFFDEISTKRVSAQVGRKAVNLNNIFLTKNGSARIPARSREIVESKRWLETRNEKDPGEYGMLNAV